MEQSPAPGSAPALGEGHYTVVLAGGGHRTLEVTRAAPDFRAGPLIVAYLCGPDNERDYRSFAHITTEGAGRLWHRFRADSALAAALAAMVTDPTVAYRRCLRSARCRRPLTHPDSIERGVGTRCARQLLAPIAEPAEAWMGPGRHPVNRGRSRIAQAGDGPVQLVGQRPQRHHALALAQGHRRHTHVAWRAPPRISSDDRCAAENRPVVARMANEVRGEKGTCP